MNYKQAKRWIQLRASALELEGMDPDKARTVALQQFSELEGISAEIRSKVADEFAPAEGEDAPARERVVIDLRVSDDRRDRVEARAAETDEADEEDEDEAPEAETRARREESREIEIRSEDLRPVVEAEARRVIADAMRRPEDSLAAVAAGLQVRTRQMEPDELLGEVLSRTMIPQLQRRAPTATELQEAENMISSHLGRRVSLRGTDPVEKRALSLEGNGTVIYNELARMFVVRPSQDVIFRNHMRSIPMGGVEKRTFPRFDRAGIAFGWNRDTSLGGALTDGNPTLDTFDIEVTNLDGKVTVDDSFALFNASGGQFVSQYLLPGMREAAQHKEDEAFFLSTGVAPYPDTFAGLHNVAGVTSVAPGTNGDAFTLDVLNSLLRAMPNRYRTNPARLVFYVAQSLADDFAGIVANRTTSLGDAYLGGQAGQTGTVPPGPAPVGFYRGIPVVPVYHLPTNETQGTATNASTISLVHRDIPVIGDALQIRIEPFRDKAFKTDLQLQEYVGLGYQWPDAIVRRAGVIPAA